MRISISGYNIDCQNFSIPCLYSALYLLKFCVIINIGKFCVIINEGKVKVKSFIILSTSLSLLWLAVDSAASDISKLCGIMSRSSIDKPCFESQGSFSERHRLCALSKHLQMTGLHFADLVRSGYWRRDYALIKPLAQVFGMTTLL